jgi:hypothetical protein
MVLRKPLVQDIRDIQFENQFPGELVVVVLNCVPQVARENPK